MTKNSTRKTKKMTRKTSKPVKLTIIVDRRERLPWTWERQRRHGAQLTTRTATLPTGDYTLPRLKNRFVIERKGGADLAQSCTTSHDRFKREHQRMAAIIRKGGFACVLVEDSLLGVCDKADRHRPGNGKRVQGTHTAWLLAYGVPWIFAGSRQEAEHIALDLLSKYSESRKTRP
jgi:ERCC4-type nuclease